MTKEVNDEPSKSLQAIFAPNNACFGCGPQNTLGLQIASYYEDGMTVATWQPAAHHEAFPGFLNGGIICSLLDCHCNWAALAHAMFVEQLTNLPCTVTAKINVKFLAPTPTADGVQLQAHVQTYEHPRFDVLGELRAQNKLTATCQATFVAVEPGHPAYHRW